MFTLRLIGRHWRTCLEILGEMGFRRGAAYIAAVVRAEKRERGL